jgi:cytochrome c peroxidase
MRFSGARRGAKNSVRFIADSSFEGKSVEKHFAEAAALIVVGTSAVMLTAHRQQSALAPPDESILPLSAAVSSLEPGRIKLGERLFNDKRLSGDGTVSCHSCHLPHAGGADTRHYLLSAFGKIRQVNLP